MRGHQKKDLRNEIDPIFTDQKIFMRQRLQRKSIAKQRLKRKARSF